MARDKTFDEKLIIKYFRELYIDFPKGKLIKSESPDFVLTVSPKYRIGIEITQLYDPLDNFSSISKLVAAIHQTLIKKDNKFPLYIKNRYNNYWLIMYVESINISRKINLQQKLGKIKFESMFDKVFLFELFGGNTFEI